MLGAAPGLAVVLAQRGFAASLLATILLVLAFWGRSVGVTTKARPAASRWRPNRCPLPGKRSSTRLGRRRLGAAAGGLLLLGGSACERFAVCHAGFQSARDPQATVGPQRARTAAAASASAANALLTAG